MASVAAMVCVTVGASRTTCGILRCERFGCELGACGGSWVSDGPAFWVGCALRGRGESSRCAELKAGGGATEGVSIMVSIAVSIVRGELKLCMGVHTCAMSRLAAPLSSICRAAVSLSQNPASLQQLWRVNEI